MNIELKFPPNFEGLVLGCIDADFCKLILVGISYLLELAICWKALAEIYTMHSFAPFWNPLAKNGEKRAWPKQPRKGRKQETERPLSSSQHAT